MHSHGRKIAVMTQDKSSPSAFPAAPWSDGYWPEFQMQRMVSYSKPAVVQGWLHELLKLYPKVI